MATVRHIGYYPQSLGLCFVRSINDISKHLPFTASLTEVLGFYWKVKEWKISANGAALVGDADPFYDEWNSTIISIPPTSEKRLVCGENILGWKNEDGSPLLTPDSLWVTSPQYDLQRSIPFFGANFLPSATYNAGELEGLGQYWEVVGSSTLNMKGTTKTWECYGIRNPDSFVYTYYANIHIEAKTFWPYDPGDGRGPIYDSTTGAQLRAFPAN